ncbi:Carboxypeptidase S1 [Aspergillus sp. HF37]|nr:Carboxypeptidase S1 [Aspergillus sp. HF37]
MHLRATGLLSLLASAASAAPASASAEDKRSIVDRDGILHNVFEHAATGAKMDFVQNSGICETTPGVNQYSGYLSVGDNKHMWFWFFEARNNSNTAPLAAWFNGGPGCSSMIGLFQEHGPCHFVNGEKMPSLNEYSWNNEVNMIYIDQPIGVGFSYGNSEVDSTDAAAPYVWKLLQAFYAQFPKYESRDFAVFTESYGGHYGPEFAHHIAQQNAAIKSGSIKGDHIDLVALGVNNGWFDAGIQEKAYIDYSYNNTYRQIITKEEKSEYMEAYRQSCLPAIQNCPKNGGDLACVNANQVCLNTIQSPLTNEADFNVYNIRCPSGKGGPPSTYKSYLQDEKVMKAIGAKSDYVECSSIVGRHFQSTGDNSRTFLPELSKVVQSGITVLVWAGDADWICNWMGNEYAAEAISFAGQQELQSKKMDPYTVDGTQKGTFKVVDNFSFLRVFEAGHMVPFYQPEASLQVFNQIMHKRPISST